MFARRLAHFNTNQRTLYTRQISPENRRNCTTRHSSRKLASKTRNILFQEVDSSQAFLTGQRLPAFRGIFAKNVRGAGILRPMAVALVSVVRAVMIRVVRFLQPARFLARQLPKFMRHIRPSGPAGVLILLVGLLGAGVAKLRLGIITNVRSCKSCSGYGIERCALCSGRGMVGWEGKWSHREPCPLCLGRRFVDCEACGGKFHRPLFCHVRTTAATLLAEIKEAEASIGGASVTE